MTPTIPALNPTAAPQGGGRSGVGADMPTPGRSDPFRGGEPASGDEPQNLEAALPWLQSAAEQAGLELSFSIDRDTDRIVVTVADRRDGSIIRQIPSEEALRIARHLQRTGNGGGLVAAVV